MSQEALSEAIGVSFQQLQKYESGKNRVSASRIVYISSVLRVTPSYFFEDTKRGARLRKAEEPEAHMIATISSDDGRRLNEAFLRLKSAPLRRSIIDMIGKIADQQDVSSASLPEVRKRRKTSVR